MLRLNPIEESQGGDEMQRILDLSQMTFEEAPNFLKVLAHSLPTLRAYGAAEKSLLNGHLTARFREQIALAVAEINSSNYCLVAHANAAKEAGLTEEEIHLARRATASEAKEEALLRFTQEVVLQRGKISDEDFCAVVKAGFSQAEVVEIIANIALNIFTNYLNLVAKTEVNFPMPQVLVER
jgi:uncharacterized peroxidase-related enzyme